MALVRTAGIAFLPASLKATPLLLAWLIDWVRSSDSRAPSSTRFKDRPATLVYIVDEPRQLMSVIFRALFTTGITGSPPRRMRRRFPRRFSRPRPALASGQSIWMSSPPSPADRRLRAPRQTREDRPEPTTSPPSICWAAQRPARARFSDISWPFEAVGPAAAPVA